MSTTFFSVVEFEKRVGNIVVTLNFNGEDKDVKIPRAKFEAWLDRTGRLAIPMQLIDETGNQQTEFSTMTMDEYYAHAEVNCDLHDFILTVKGETVFADTLKEIEAICGEYKN